MTLFFKNFDKGEARKSLAGDGPVGNSPEENECYFPDLNIKVGNELIKLDSYVNLNKGDGPYISFCFHKSPFDLTYFYKSYKSAADFINDLCSLKSKYKVLTPALLEKMGFLTEMA
jgi:hypothetical protein